ENKEIDWRQAKYLIINVTDFYLAERISIRPEFIFDKKIPHEAEQEFIFNLKASQQLYDNIIKEQKDHNFESDNEEENENEENESDTQSENESDNENANDNIPDEIPGIYILDLFEPLLLKHFKQYGIKIVTNKRRGNKYVEEITPNSFVEIY